MSPETKGNTKKPFSGRDPEGTWVLAVLNVGLLKQPMGQDIPTNKEFEQSLEPVMMIAERSEGFVWRFSSKIHGPTDKRYQEISDCFPDRMLINLSVWESVDDLKHFVFRSGHASYYRRRKAWFEKEIGFDKAFGFPTKTPHHVCWWFKMDGRDPHCPVSWNEGMERLRYLAEHNSTPYAFSFGRPFPPPNFGEDGAAALKGANGEKENNKETTNNTTTTTWSGYFMGWISSLTPREA